MFEHNKQPLATREIFLRRLIKFVAIAFALAAVSLLIGILGYHYLEKLSWIDSLLNASMILSGMGPAAILKTSAGKLFASFYALFSGMIFLAAAGIIITPILHRFLHIFHVEASKASAPKAVEKTTAKTSTRAKASPKNHKHDDEDHRPKTLLDF